MSEIHLKPMLEIFRPAFTSIHVMMDDRPSCRFAGVASYLRLSLRILLWAHQNIDRSSYSVMDGYFGPSGLHYCSPPSRVAVGTPSMEPAMVRDLVRGFGLPPAPFSGPNRIFLLPSTRFLRGCVLVASRVYEGFGAPWPLRWLWKGLQLLERGATGVQGRLSHSRRLEGDSNGF